jgi:hypothetical protein
MREPLLEGAASGSAAVEVFIDKKNTIDNPKLSK